MALVPHSSRLTRVRRGFRRFARTRSLAERYTFDPPPTNARGLEHELELELGELRMPGQPCQRSCADAPHLLFVDHLQRMPELGPALLLHLDDEKAAASPYDEIELVATDARVGVEKFVTAKSVVAKGAALAAIHAAS